MTCLNKDGNPFMTGTAAGAEGTMYEVEVFTPTGPLNAMNSKPPLIAAAKDAHARVLAFATRSHTKPTDIDTWHRRLGHVGYTTIEHMGRGTAVRGMDITTYDRGPGSCEDCIMGKQTRRPFDDNTERETSVLDRVYIDLWGPARTKSNGGKSYMMQVVDGMSAHTEAYFLADKSAETTLEAFKSYHAQAERQTGRKLKCVRTDGGGEFCNDLWETYCRVHGIIHETTTAYSSQSNGVVERSNRTVIERVRVLLHDGNLPASMWCETAATVVYLKDFVPTVRHPDITPFEDWRGFKPDISHLRPFGCTAYAKIPVETDGGKLAPRSLKCVLIGYFGRDAYRVLDRSSGRTYRSRDVIFEEGVGHRTLDQDGPANTGEEDSDVLGQPVIDSGHQVPTHTAPDTDASDVSTIYSPQTQPDIPRRSTRSRVPSQALLRSQESNKDVEAAAREGRDWATNNTVPEVFNAFVKSSIPATLPEPDNFWLPDSYTEAMSRPDIWQGPIDKELNVMKDRSVWEIVDPPTNVRTIGTRWTFANKYDSDGKLISRKARLVAKGFTQIPGVDFFETYASVVRYESLRMNLAIAAANNMEAWQVDYVAAYLNSKPQADIYIELPDGAKVQGKIGKLNKTLYGTMDGAYNWWKTLDEEMSELGYYRSKADPSVRSRHANGNITITSTYTDDTTGISSSVDEAKRAKEELGWKYEIKDLGEANMILGIHIERDRSAGTISLSQRAYLERVLKRFGMSDCNPSSTPLPLGIVLSKAQSPQCQEDRQYMANKQYREVLGSIMYAQIATRPDLSYAVSTLSKYSSNPGVTHWKALNHVLRYIKGTLHYKIVYGGEGSKDLKPVGWVDADYGGDTDSRRSCAGYVFLQAGGPTAWSAQYQQTVALSTTEAEYMAVARGAKQLLWMFAEMGEVGFPQEKPGVLYNDNSGAVALTRDTKHNSRVKHIDIRHHFIRDCVENQDIVVLHVPSTENLADLFTKSLGRVAHRRFCTLLRLCDDTTRPEHGGVL
jgi:hypothetical protein